MKLKPMADNILLKQTEAEETTSFGIILATTNKEKPAIFEVVSAGPDVKGIASGDKVVVGNFVGSELTSFDHGGLLALPDQFLTDRGTVDIQNKQHNKRDEHISHRVEKL